MTHNDRQFTLHKLKKYSGYFYGLISTNDYMNKLQDDIFFNFLIEV